MTSWQRHSFYILFIHEIPFWFRPLHRDLLFSVNYSFHPVLAPQSSAIQLRVSIAFLSQARSLIH